MAKILISSGPTRQYIDPVRYISNASSGQMGCALATSAIERGHEVVIVSGPVSIAYPSQAEVISVTTTDEMLDVCLQQFDSCDGMIGTAAPCDYRPVQVADQKIKKTGGPLVLHLIETEDIVATLGARKRADQWVIGFALETEDAHFRAIGKLHKKCCDYVVINGPQAMNSRLNSVEIMDPQGNVVAQYEGPKEMVGHQILKEIQERLID